MPRPRLEVAGIVVFWSANWPATKAILVYASPLQFTALRFALAMVAMAAVTACESAGAKVIVDYVGSAGGARQSSAGTMAVGVGFASW